MQISLLTAFAVEGEKSAEYFPIGMKWKEVLATPGIPLDTITATLYEIGDDTLIGTVRYKEVFRNNKRCKLWIREEGQVVWLLTSDYPTEIKLYDFDWDRKESTVEVLREYGENFELCSASINFEDRKTTYTETLSYEYISKHDGTLIRGVGRVSELNRDACLLGYKLPEVMLPGLEYHKILWITRDGETVFRSNDSNEWIDSIPKLSESDQIIDDRFLGFMLYENGECSYYTLSGNCTIDGIDYIKEDNGRYCYRQEGNRVYCYSLAEQKEYLVMDFGLKVGDVFPLYEGLSLQVEMISDTLISSDWGTDVTCKRLHLRGVEQPAFQDMWVEGFGSVRYGINPPESIDKLLCSDLMYAVSDEFIYMVNFSRDDKWGLEVPLGEEHPNIDLPYPPYRWQNDSVAFTLSDGRLNIDGYVWNDCFGPLYMLIREEGETITINTYELPDYADCYSYYKTNVTVAGLDQDRYTLLYNGKNLELAKDSTTVLLPVETTQGNDDTNKEPDNPNTDQDTLAIKNFTLNVDVLNLLVSETFQLKLTWDYPEAEDIYAKHVAYSYNDRVISIDSEGLITARSEGQTDVQVSCLGVEKSFKVIVKENTSTSVQHRGRMTLPMGTFCDDKGNNFNVTLTNNTLHLQGTFWGHACIPSELNYEILDGTAYFTIHTNQEDSTCTDGYQGSFAISQTIDVEFADCVSEAYNVYVNNTLSSIYAAPEQKVYYVCATRIEDIGSLPNDTPYYDLQGRKVVSPTRGIYIKDGKKMVIK